MNELIPEYITVVYKVNDWTKFKETNPMEWEHNGLQAIGVAAYDAIKIADELMEAI